MNTQYTPSTIQTKVVDAVDCQALILEAGRELGAFFEVVASMFGSQEAEHAAERWLEILESDVAFIHNLGPSFRNITIQAAISLASRWINQSHYAPGPSDQASASRDMEFSACADPPARRYGPSVRLLQ
jgi:hypothetical protein